MVFGFGGKKEGPPAAAAAAPDPEAGMKNSDSLISPDIQDKLLQDPKVKEMMKKAGEKGLSDPDVQKQILETCKDKFPEYAADATSKVKAWAADPDTQAKAKEYAGVLAAYAAVAGETLMRQIEQGPAGVRVLSFFVSLMSGANAIWGLVQGVMGGILALNLVACVIAIYQLIFSFTTLLFEAKPEWLITIQDKTGVGVSRYQDMLLENAKFLALAGGRGAFYLFQGSLWLAASGGLAHPINLGVGICLVLVGILHLLMHCGIAPIDIATKMRTGYQKVGETVSSARQQ